MIRRILVKLKLVPPYGVFELIHVKGHVKFNLIAVVYTIRQAKKVAKIGLAEQYVILPTYKND